MFDGVSAIGGSRRLVVGVACAVLLMAVVEFGCESVGSQKEPAASSPSPSPASDDASAAQAEKPVEEAVQRLQWKINDAIEHVGRDFGAPPLFPESVVQAIADRRVRLAGEYSADDRIIDRNRNMQTYGGRAGVVASEQGGREVESHSFRSCEALFSRIEAASSPRAFGRARWKIEVTPLEIRHDDQTLVRRTCTDRFECRTEADAEQ
ncbi:MAG: hypothetical protein ACOC9J_05275, partial [Persicimonas sp.]